MLISRFLIFFILILSSFSAFSREVVLNHKNYEIIGAELWIADSSDSAIESRFGHSLLRFVTKESTFDDPILSFEMNPPQSVSAREFIIGGVIGDFPTVVRPMTLLDVLIDYSQTNNRGFRKLPLRLSSTQLNSLIHLANAIISGRIKMPNYSFANFNCARAVTWFFEEANITLYGNELFPTQLIQQMRYSLIAPWQDQIVPAGSTIINKIQHSINSNGDLHIEKNILQALQKKEVYILSVANYKFTESTKKSLKEILGNFSGDLVKIYNIKGLQEFEYVSRSSCKNDLLSSLQNLTKPELRRFTENFIDISIRLKYSNSIRIDDPSSEKSIHQVLSRINQENRNNDLMECYQLLTKNNSKE